MNQPADAGGGDVHQVRFAVFNHFGIAAGNRDAGLPRGLGHGADFRFQNRRRQPGLKDVSDDQSLSPGAGNGKVVDGAVDRQFADGTSGKAQRLDYETVGRDRDRASH